MTTAVEAPGASPFGAEQLDVRYYGGLLWRSRTLIAASALAGLLLGLFVAYLQTPEYRASAMLQIDPPTPTFMTVTDALLGGGGYWQNTDFYNTQFKILQSKALGDKVLDRLKLVDRAPYKDNPGAGSLFMQHVRIIPIPESRLVTIDVTLPDPNEAALWANALAEVYIENSLATRVDAAQRANDWLQERLAATQQHMRDAQERLFKGYQNQDLFVSEGSQSAVSTSITQLNSDYVDVQRRRIQLEAAFKQAADMQGRGEGIERLPQVASDGQMADLSAQIAGLRIDMSQLREKYKEAHPEVQKLEARIAEIEKARSARATAVVDGLHAEFAQLQKREQELRSAIDVEKQRATDQSRKVTELETLRREADSSKGLYDVLLQKLNETDIAASIRSNTVALVERAVPPSSAAYPDKKRTAGIALVLGLVFGVGLVLTRDFLDHTLKSPDEIERYLHAELLAAVPRYDERSVHLVTEAYQNLRTALIFGRREDRGHVVLVAGSAPQEGKTTTLVNIGKLLASSGEKTVVVDADLRRAQLHERLGLERHLGLTDYFVKQRDVAGILKSTRVPNLSAITAGQLPPNPPALLARRSLGTLLDELRERFEWVLVDSPPLASVTDALLLARHADLVVFVIQHNKVDKKLIKRSLTAIRKATPHVLGVVLNGVDVNSKGHYYYYYQQHGDVQTERSGPKALGSRD